MKRILMSLWNYPAVIINWCVLRVKKVKIAAGVKIIGRIRVRNKGNIYIGSNTVIYCSPKTNKLGAQIRTYFITDNAKAEIKIGNNVQLSNLVLNASNYIELEDNVMIGGGVRIFDTDFHSINYVKRMQKPDNSIKTSPVIVREGAFIGAYAIILKGVEIGAKSVVGAGSVVTKSIPAGQIWAGNPAKFVRNCE